MPSTLIHSLNHPIPVGIGEILTNFNLHSPWLPIAATDFAPVSPVSSSMTKPQDVVFSKIFINSNKLWIKPFFTNMLIVSRNQAFRLDYRGSVVLENQFCQKIGVLLFHHAISIYR